MERMVVVESSGSRLELATQRNLLTGVDSFIRQVGPLSSLEIDLMITASAIFAADLAFKRGERENITRAIAITIPVVNIHAFRGASNTIQNLLYLLSNDYWDIRFATFQGQPIQPSKPDGGSGDTLLFSGGLDSLAAAVQALEANQELLLASHFTGNPITSKSQLDLSAYLGENFTTLKDHIRVRVGGRSAENFHFPSDSERESTQRTRSFVFLIIAGIVAWRLGNGTIVHIAENGQLAVNLPLTASRIGAFSTHTAHPSVLVLMEQLLSEFFDTEFSIVNPFLYKTKAEAISPLYPTHEAAANLSISCWKSSRQSEHHCGECIPCLVRRIAVEYLGSSVSGYRRDLFAESLGHLSETDTGKINMGEMLEFVVNFGGRLSDHELIEGYPELINSSFELGPVLEMYRRFATEALSVFQKYPAIGAVL